MRYKLVIANLTSDFYRLFKVSASSAAVIISLFSIIRPVVSQVFFLLFSLFPVFIHRGEKKTHWTLSPWRTSPWSSSGTSSFSEELVCFSPGCSFIHFTQNCTGVSCLCFHTTMPTPWLCNINVSHKTILDTLHWYVYSFCCVRSCLVAYHSVTTPLPPPPPTSLILTVTMVKDDSEMVFWWKSW